ncbi:MAG: Anthranilate 1,2-dioxygenase small subunit [Alphaproteobacteria bacterium MarineAlpha11_Bin1]|nr:MAG: Anthranilate 1,2-dioxygenase small subunit [Alphaproteobacteria bacterium MarineAlpha11_Bin1]|tara:strand:+ start:1317 stop:1805 length:489 start_codon:yes stop_codon:yes gene_type:complete
MDGAVSIGTDVQFQIERMITDYAHAIDDDRLEMWPEFFTDDCSYRIINRENYAKGRRVGIMDCSSKGMLRDRILALREANVYEPHCYRHLQSGIRIVGDKDGAYQVETSFMIVRTMQEGDMSLFCAGKFIDEIVFEGSLPRFRKRIVVTDSNRIHTLIVIPI